MNSQSNGLTGRCREAAEAKLHQRPNTRSGPHGMAAAR